jgi:hypothetical protein
MQIKQFHFLKCVFKVILTILPTALLVPSCASDLPQNNDRVGNLLVFNQNYSETSTVPGNVFTASELAPFYTVNETISYNTEKKCVRFDATQGAIGKLIVGGLSPCLSTSISLDIEIGGTEQDKELNIVVGNAWLIAKIIRGFPSDTLRIYSYYYNPKLDHVRSDIDIDANKTNRFMLKIETDSPNRTNSIFINGVKKISSPILWGDSNYSPTEYDPFVNPVVYFYFTKVLPGNSAYLDLFSVTQTVPEYRFITPISNSKIVPFGIDDFRDEYVHNGLAFMASAGQRGTIWADVAFVQQFSEEDFKSLRDLISSGWELGIHYSKSLNTLSWDDAKALMDNEYNTIKNTFQTTPTTWCSLENSDNATHADYAYSHLGMVWRNGKNGVEILTNIGNIMEDDWNFWAKSSEAGAVFPVFTHRIDGDSAIKYSISYDHFSSYVKNYIKNGLQIVGFYEYWETVQNSYYTTISNLNFDKNHIVNFTISNMGGKSRLFIAEPDVVKILNGNNQTVNFDKIDGGIIVQVVSGTYHLVIEKSS